jgi:hypothetical protein
MNATKPGPTPGTHVPDDLGELDRWGVWRLESGAKIPYRSSGGRASSTNPHDWGELEQARRALRAGRYTGLAFALFRDDGLTGIDLDDCLANGEVKLWARGVVERFGDSYQEVSPSLQGLKIWVRGALPANVSGVKVGDGQIEMYDHGRYFTVTGRAFRSAPLQVENHAADLQTLYRHLTADRKRSWPLQPLQSGRIQYGQQHSTLVSIAGTLRRRHVCDQAIEACLQAINAYQCEQPGPPENISRIVRSSRPWGEHERQT